MNNPFSINQITGKEVFSSQITGVDAVTLISSFISIGLCYGVDRVENAIKNTYTSDVSFKIIAAINAYTAQW